jgi:hypothetical protein
MKRVILMIAMLLMITGCKDQQDILSTSTMPDEQPPQEVTVHEEISWVDIICVGDRHYMRNEFDGTNPIPIGDEVAKVMFNVSSNIFDSSYRIKDGDATFLPVGTPIYEVTGYSPTTRLAVVQGGVHMIYDVNSSESATHGSDLLDIDNKVDYITLNDENDGVSVLAEIRDEKDVQAIVTTIMTEPLFETYDSWTGQRYFIEFHLKDGTSINRSYWIETGFVSPNLQLTLEINEMIQGYLE